ncbi:MAG: PASTA domain-containing protein [Acidimicrobiia bacterium]
MTDLPTVKRTAEEVERDVLAYEAAVADALGDLPLETQSELLDGLHDHLVEIAAEGELLELIGPPDKYAAELRGDTDSARLATEPSAPSSAVGEPAVVARPTMPHIAVPWKRIAQIAVLVLVAYFALQWLFDLNGVVGIADVVAPALVAGGLLLAAWWVAQRMVRPEWRRTVGIVLVGAALLTASRLGASAGIHGERISSQGVYPPEFLTATTGSPISVTPGAPANIPAPDVRGMRRDRAFEELSNRGLMVNIEEVSVARASGDIVIDQDPAPDSLVPIGATVTIRVAVPTNDESAPAPSSTFPSVSTQVASTTVPTNLPNDVPTSVPAAMSVTTVAP